MKALIIDDHPLIVEGLASLLAELAHPAEIHSATSVQTALHLFSSKGPFDLVMLDVSMPDAGGIELIRRLRTIQADAHIVVVSAEDHRQTVLEALNAGAKGLISKFSSTQVLSGALKLVLSGGVYIPPKVLDGESGGGWVNTPAPQKRHLGLTDRQTEVLALLVEGKPNKLICRELNVSEGTVKTHVSAIFRTLNVSNRAQVAYALNKLGLPLPQRRGAAIDGGSAMPARLPTPQHE